MLCCNSCYGFCNMLRDVAYDAAARISTMVVSSRTNKCFASEGSVIYNHFVGKREGVDIAIESKKNYKGKTSRYPPALLGIS
ncbi:UNVERIFIED_CONTAM: hypothetical protein NCL1_11449 [Trichonephila clavipes]